MRDIRRLLLAAAALAALTGCGTAPAGDAPPVAAQTVRIEAPEPAPTAVTIPRIGATSSLIGLGKDADGRAAVPPVNQPGQASWYEPGPRPGATGPAVIFGHVSGRPDGATSSVPGVFARLAEVVPGDEVLVGRADGSTAVFEVTAVVTHPKDMFPTEAVYGDRTTPVLRLVTCGGDFDTAARSYLSNVIVFAALAGVR